MGSGLAALAGSSEPDKPQADKALPKRTEEPGPHKVQPPSEAFLKRLWTVTDLVLQHHPNPPTRQQMYQSGTEALLKAAGVARPADLPRRLASVATEKQCADFLREVWPQMTDSPAVTAEKLETAMLSGSLQHVPGEVQFISPLAVKLTEQLQGNRYEGTGIQITHDPNENLPQIKIPIRRGPAQRAGALPNDLIVQVDGVDMRGLALSKVVDMIRGDAGKPVTFVVRQPNTKETRTLKIMRDVVPFETLLGCRRATEDVWSFRVDPAAPIAYVWMQSLTGSALHELRQIERQVQSEGLRALVLDLRSCPGGDIHHAALVADGLLDGELMWRARGAHNQVKEYRADRDCLFRGWPLVVLLDETTGTAPSAIAAALQDNGRAILVGEPSKSKGSLRSQIPLPDGQGALSLLTGTLERATPQRGWPVQPDHSVSLTPEQRKTLANHFMAKPAPGQAVDADKPTPEDPQLAKALALLRAKLEVSGQPKTSR
jgi:carboxyl-terminal processing protease